jgi:UDPglucose--hexose-1-phosphate uridylyltransferase
MIGMDRSAGTPAGSAAPVGDVRVDPYLGNVVHVVGSRQARPNQPDNTHTVECPFCPGGLEAPEPYDVRWFPNRWPAMPDARCEVVLYSPRHDASMATLGRMGIAKVIDLWAARSAALGNRPDIAYVLVFENRGASVGATIAHPHGQIYAYDHVPSRPARLFGNGWRPDSDESRLVSANDGWTCVVPFASEYPIALSIAPRRRIGDLTSLDATDRGLLAELLATVFEGLDALFAEPLPYMMWINQRPFDGSFDDAWMSIDIVSPWRSAGLARYIAAAEVGAGEFFNPVVPEDIATRLRSVLQSG